MTGKLDISRRIHCALDGTRVRTSFSKRGSLCAVGFSLVLWMVLGSIQFRARAVEPQEETKSAGTEQREGAKQKESRPVAQSQVEKAVDEEARSMTIRVVDEHSQPLEGVDVYVTGIDYERRGGTGNLPRIHYPTNVSGETRVNFRDGTLSLQIWPRIDGYVPQYVQFDEKKLALPADYTFHWVRSA